MTEAHHWSEDRYWTEALEQFDQLRNIGFVELDLFAIQEAAFLENGPAFKLMEAMVSVWQCEAAEGYRGACRVLLATLVRLQELTHPFRRDAVEFLNQYRKLDRRCILAMRQGTPDEKRQAIASFMSVYGIARNFPGSVKHDPEKYVAVIEELEKTDVSAFENISDRVLDLESRLYTRYGGRRRLSAASKLLWLIHPNDSILIDSLTAKSLGFATDRTTYSQYVAAWQERFSDAASQIAEVCQTLSVEPDLASDICQTWFHQRVWDFHLVRSEAKKGEGKQKAIRGHREQSSLIQK